MTSAPFLVALICLIVCVSAAFTAVARPTDEMVLKCQTECFAQNDTQASPPVCGSDNQTYPSTCALSCVGRATHGADICFLPKEVGFCRAAFFAWYYYDHLVGHCVDFIYGGCGVNKNNFDTREDCEKACAHLEGIVTKAGEGMCKSTKPEKAEKCMKKYLETHGGKTLTGHCSEGDYDCVIERMGPEARAKATIAKIQCNSSPSAIAVSSLLLLTTLLLWALRH